MITFWFRTEPCCNRRRNLVPHNSGARYAWHTYQKPALENGVDLWRRFLERVSWVLVDDWFSDRVAAAALLQQFVATCEIY